MLYGVCVYCVCVCYLFNFCVFVYVYMGLYIYTICITFDCINPITYNLYKTPSIHTLLLYRAEALDPTIRGRFANEIPIPVPDAKARSKILQYKCHGVNYDSLETTGGSGSTSVSGVAIEMDQNGRDKCFSSVQ